MVKTNIPERRFVDIEEYNEMLKDYSQFILLDKESQDELKAQYKKVSNTETPGLAFARHGTPIPENWKEILFKINKEWEEFYQKHPYFLADSIARELETALNSKGIVIKNDFRKGRESINTINVLKNDTYIVFIYNRSINSTQSTVEFSGVPLEAIERIPTFLFLKKYIPTKNHAFKIKTESWNYVDFFGQQTNTTTHHLIVCCGDDEKAEQ